MGLGLSLKASQGLSLTPQLQQSIRLLQLSTTELNQEIQAMLMENPFLRLEDEDELEDVLRSEEATIDDGPLPEEPFGSDTLADGNIGEASESHEMPDEVTSWDGDGSVEASVLDAEWAEPEYATSSTSARLDGDVRSDFSDASEITLTQHLLAQVPSHRYSDAERFAIEHIIGCLDERGFLCDSVDEIALALLGEAVEGAGGAFGVDLGDRDRLVDMLQWALAVVQALEPSGVGAIDLLHCLRLQLRFGAIRGVCSSEEAEDALLVLALPLEWIARKDVRKLCSELRFEPERVSTALTTIANLHPRPVAEFVGAASPPVVPDVVVRRVRNGFHAVGNSAAQPRLSIDAGYANALRGVKGDGHQAWQQHLQEAKWFVKNVQQRCDTILRVSKVIVERQQQFFLLGAIAMRPLVLREIADELGLHESTISRVTTSKYISTPFGTFELKYFFGSSLDTDSGGNTSSTAVKALIRQFIESESPQAALSDAVLSEKLKCAGIICARRTVAKYREAMRIAPASLRA